MQYRVEQIANFFIRKGLEVGRPVDHLKLQKLIYFAHAWHLALFDGEALIDEDIQAWRYGPVVGSLYRVLKANGMNPIKHLISTGTGFSTVPIPEPEEAMVREFLDVIWEKYGMFSAVELSTLSHQPDGPWSHYYSNEVENRTIPNNFLADYYRKLAKED